MPTSTDPQQLADVHARLRRFYDRLWLAFALAIVAISTVAWAVTSDIGNFYGGLFYAAFPFFGFLRNHFYFLNPGRDPATTQKRIEMAYQKQQRNARTSARVNGWMLVIASPVISLISIGEGAKEGIVLAILGILLSLSWLGIGVFSIRYGRRSRRV